MAKINNLRMGKTICTDLRIGIRKSLFGLRTQITYIPTNSIVEVKKNEYNSADGARLLDIVEKPEKPFDDFRPQPTANGNYIAEVCLSQDHNFLAVQLFHYMEMNYEPVTEVLIFENDKANQLSKLF